VNALETIGLSKRYGWAWALRDCTLAVPSGHVVALVGPNGAGKTTLLHLAVGLTAPTTGHIAVVGGAVPGSDPALGRIGFVAQDTPLYKNLSVADTLRMVASLSSTFDAADARRRLDDLGIPLDRKVGKLSGGQQAQVALTVALARHPELLVLDEPVARLDPLARHQFMAALMAAVATDGISVLFSSHVVAELERVCDYLVLLAHGRVQVAGEVEELVNTHVVLNGPTAQADALAASVQVVRDRRGERQASLLVRAGHDARPPAGWQAEPTNLEELVLAYLQTPDVAALPGPRPVRRDSCSAATA
jgi:ABC-2 type transport system ATP-binding protein